MEESTYKNVIIRLQRSLLIIVIIFLAGAVLAEFYDRRIGLILNYISLGILIVAAPVRMISVSDYFRKTRNRKYQFLSYMVIGIIVLAAILKGFIH